MSMLAEPRRRQKWTLNPRGNLWAKDDSRFGKKLLEKMGWEEGKGLGSTSQGITAPIMVRAKDNNKGIGYQGRDDVWLDHQNDFDDLLASLNQQTNAKIDENPMKIKSLEETSKTSKKRVHYKKFTRGKDISQFSAEDLGCILGGKKKEARKTKVEVKKTEIEELAEEADLSDDVNGVKIIGFQMTEEKAQNECVDIMKNEKSFVTLNRGSMNDYFMQKMKAKAAIKSVNEPVMKIDSIINESELEEPETAKKTKRKKNVPILKEEIDDFDYKADEQKTLKEEKDANIDTEKNKKRKAEKLDVNEEYDNVETSNLKEEPNYPDSTVEEKRKKVKKLTTKEEKDANIDTEKNKKRKAEKLDVNEEYENGDLETEKQKKKKRKAEKLNLPEDLDSGVHESNKKKKKKGPKENTKVEEVELQVNEDDSAPSKVKTKTKSKKVDHGKEPVKEDSDSDESPKKLPALLQEQDKETLKKAKKKKSKWSSHNENEIEMPEVLEEKSHKKNKELKSSSKTEEEDESIFASDKAGKTQSSGGLEKSSQEGMPNKKIKRKKEEQNLQTQTWHKNRINKKMILKSLPTTDLTKRLGFKGANLENIKGYGSNLKPIKK